MSKGDMVKFLQENTEFMEGIKTFDYALPQGLLEALAREYSQYYLCTEREAYENVRSRFIYVYYHSQEGHGSMGSSLFCIFPDRIGQEILQVLGGMKR